MARSSTKSYEIDMLNGAIFPKLLRFAVPVTTHWRQWAPTRL